MRSGQRSGTRAVPALFATALLIWSFWLPGVAAADPVTVIDCCTGTDHAPEDPIDGAPSKQVFAATVPRDFAAQTFTITIDGPSGSQTGSGAVGPDGSAQVEVPIYQHGEHHITSADVGGELIEPGHLVPLGRFMVDDTERACSSAQLQPEPASSEPTTAPSPSSPATMTPAPPAAVASPAPAASPTPTAATPAATPATAAAPVVAVVAPQPPAAGVEVTPAPGGGTGGEPSRLLPWVALGLVVTVGGAGVGVRSRQGRGAVVAMVGGPSSESMFDDLEDAEAVAERAEAEALAERLREVDRDNARFHERLKGSQRGDDWIDD